MTTKGAGGNDVPENLVNLCRKCHNNIHSQGRFTFISRNPKLYKWLKEMGRWDVLNAYNAWWDEKKSKYSI